MTRTIRKTSNYEFYEAMSGMGYAFINLNTNDISLFDCEMPMERVMYLIGCDVYDFEFEAATAIQKYPTLN